MGDATLKTITVHEHSQKMKPQNYEICGHKLEPQARVPRTDCTNEQYTGTNALRAEHRAKCGTAAKDAKILMQGPSSSTSVNPTDLPAITLVRGQPLCNRTFSGA